MTSYDTEIMNVRYADGTHTVTGVSRDFFIIRVNAAAPTTSRDVSTGLAKSRKFLQS